MITKQAEALLKLAQYTIADWANDERRRHDDTYYDDKGRLIAGSLGLTAGAMAAGLGRHAYVKHLGWNDRSALHNALLAASAGGIAGEGLARYLYNKAMDIDLSAKRRRQGQRKTANMAPLGLAPYPEEPPASEAERRAEFVGGAAGTMYGLGRASTLAPSGRLGRLARLMGIGAHTGIGALSGKAFHDLTEFARADQGGA